MNGHLYVGPIVQTSDDGQLLIKESTSILVEDGKIKNIEEMPDLSALPNSSITILKPGQFFIPGFIDCHIHAVQLPNIGTGYDKNLLDWLSMYTFPLERKFSDEKYADKVFDAVVKRTLSVGTTTACYFASLYGNSSIILADKASQYRQRAFIGKVNMDRKRDDNYYEITEESLKNTEKFVRSVLDLNDPLVKPIITPRFALSCTMEVMKGLAKIAKDHNLNIQTHVSENQSEIEICKEMFPDCPTYTDVYETAELLTHKTILAHGVYLEDVELELLKQRRTAIIHCPSSNTCLKSGLCDIQRLRSHGIKVGLGTDVAGGQSVCILDAMRSAIQVSNHLALLKKEPYEPINYVDAFHLATVGGAKALGIYDRTGDLSVGKEFDALVIDVNTPNGPLDNLKNYTLNENLQRFIYSGDDRNIVEVFVSGNKVKSII
ncbi:hypothetical protein PV327_008256 [Microctonus hyperodae]|uniref:Guanine deaminase n=1 Tax=Microctonus hyperodae TaxID=165561 RepID=A0AA39F2P8_MICHY|nr:hypothetical protein PV327_008256 [Microctonus hyperodae]